jgi:hypothetical protein
MSRRMVECVEAHSRTHGTVYHLLATLARLSHDEDRYAYPSVDWLANKLRVDRRNVQRAIGKAVGMGELLVTDGGGRGRANIYQVFCAIGGANAALCGIGIAAAERAAPPPGNRGVNARKARRRHRPIQGNQEDHAAPATSQSEPPRPIGVVPTTPVDGVKARLGTYEEMLGSARRSAT